MQHAVILEHGGELLGVSLEARHVLFGEIEHAGDVVRLPVGNLEHLLEGAHLVLGHVAVDLGHLGAQRDHANGERDLLLGRGVSSFSRSMTR